jgi:hypothetical protein
MLPPSSGISVPGIGRLLLENRVFAFERGQDDALDEIAEGHVEVFGV